MVSLVTGMALLAALGGPIGYSTFPAAVKLGVGLFMNLKEGGMVYPTYMNPPFPSEAAFYLFEVKNPKEVLQGGKMSLATKGPYFYDAYIRRDNIAFTDGGEKVKFHTHRKMYLNEAKSANLDERFWLLNPIVPSTLKTVRSLVLDRIPFQRVTEPIVFNTVNVLLDNFKERLIQKRSPRELLEGRKVELLESVTSLADRFGLKSLVPPGPPENTFGVAHFQNNTVDVQEIYTGVGSTKHKFGEVFKWRDGEKLKIWQGKCNEIQGTNGELYKPDLTPGKSIRVFLGQLCRTFDMDPVQPEPVIIHDGLKALEYEITPRLYLGARNNPKNKCFCSDTKAYDCQFDGFINMGPCFFDAPIYLARSNFKGVDRRIRSLVDEEVFENKLPEKQSFYLEPNTGAILKVNLTLVSAVKVVKQRYMRDLANVQDLTYAPAFVASETIEVPLSLTRPLLALQFMFDHYRTFYLVLTLGGVAVLALKFIIWGRGSKKAVGPEAGQPSAQPTQPDARPNRTDEREIEGQ